MLIKKAVNAGTLESCDIHISIEPSEKKEIFITSSVEKQYGKRIKQIIEETLDELEVENVRLNAVDRGALDCTIKARVMTAIQRSSEEKLEIK